MSGRAVLACALLIVSAAGPAAPAVPVLALVPPGEPGERLIVSGQVVSGAGVPIAGARLHAYQTDSTVRYTRERAMDEPHARLAGWVTTDNAGRFEIRSSRERDGPGRRRRMR